MKFSTVKNILQILTSKNFWRKPSEYKFMVIDRSGSEELFQNEIIDTNQTFILSIRNFEWLNIYIFVWLIKERKISILRKERYVFVVLFYLNYVKPKFVITWMDYITSFYKLKGYHPNSKYISLQVGRRSNEPDEFFDRLAKMRDDNLSCDYIFCFGEAHANEYSKFIDCNAIPSGSVRNNNISINNKVNSANRKKILYISQYRKPRKDKIFATYGEDKILWEAFFKAETILLPLLDKYCNKNSLRLTIASSIKSTMDSEKKFYDKLIGNKNYDFIERTSSVSNYQIVDDFPYIVGVDSTLLSEALGRGKRVAFFDCRGMYTNIPFCVFGWPMKLPLKGNFWTNDIEKGDVDRILDYIINKNYNDWEKDFNSVKQGLMNYDNNNSILRNIID
jgi:surface carbohydrate biosynthesis protein